MRIPTNSRTRKAAAASITTRTPRSQVCAARKMEPVSVSDPDILGASISRATRLPGAHSPANPAGRPQRGWRCRKRGVALPALHSSAPDSGFEEMAAFSKPRRRDPLQRTAAPELRRVNGILHPGVRLRTFPRDVVTSASPGGRAIYL